MWYLVLQMLVVWIDIVELVHERKKPLKCDICDKGFNQRVTWNSMLQQFMKNTNHLNATLVTKNVHKKHFGWTCYICSWRKEETKPNKRLLSEPKKVLSKRFWLIQSRLRHKKLSKLATMSFRGKSDTSAIYSWGTRTISFFI